MLGFGVLVLGDYELLVFRRGVLVRGGYLQGIMDMLGIQHWGVLNVV